MENTSCGENCCFVKAGICKSENECPNFIESCWESQESKKTVFVKDCAPKRMMSMAQDQANLTINTLNQVNRLQEKIESLNNILADLIEESRFFLTEEQKKIEVKK